MSLTLDPNLAQLRPPDPDEEDNESLPSSSYTDAHDFPEVSSDEDEEPVVREVKADFFAREKRPKQLVCPFSDASRANSCFTHAVAKSRKDVIERHLEKVKSNGGDEQHPLDDPLWNTFEVVWFLTPRPKFDEKV